MAFASTIEKESCPILQNDIQIAKSMQNDKLCDLNYQLPESYNGI